MLLVSCIFHGAPGRASFAAAKDMQRNLIFERQGSGLVALRRVPDIDKPLRLAGECGGARRRARPSPRGTTHAAYLRVDHGLSALLIGHGDSTRKSELALVTVEFDFVHTGLAKRFGGAVADLVSVVASGGRCQLVPKRLVYDPNTS